MMKPHTIKRKLATCVLLITTEITSAFILQINNQPSPTLSRYFSPPHNPSARSNDDATYSRSNRMSRSKRAMLLLTEEDVRLSLQNDNIESCISATRNALLSLTSPKEGDGGASSVIIPQSIGLPLTNDRANDKSSSSWRDSNVTDDDAKPKDWTLFKTAAYYPQLSSTQHEDDIVDDDRSTLMGMKVVSIRSKNPSIGKPTTPATVLLLNAETGEVQAIIGGTYLTAARTAAGSAIATAFCWGKLEMNSSSEGGVENDTTNTVHLVVFGAGLQAELHVRTLSHTMGHLMGITIVNRSIEHAERLRERVVMGEGYCPGLTVDNVDCISLSDSSGVEQAVRRADVIVTATKSTTPLFKGGWVKRGCHINSVGSYSKFMEEVDSNFVKERCWTFIDTMEAMKVGELTEIIGGSDNYIGLLGDALRGDVAIPPIAKEQHHDEPLVDCTFFKSVGTAIEDVFTANEIVKYAEANNIGTYVNM